MRKGRNNMEKYRRNNVEKYKGIVIFPLLSFLVILFISNLTFSAQRTDAGNLIGHVFGADKNTPVQGAVVRVKNINDGAVYTSFPTDSRGTFTITGIREGIYIVGVTSPQGDFNTDNLIGVKESQTSSVSFILSPYEEEVARAIIDLYRDDSPGAGTPKYASPGKQNPVPQSHPKRIAINTRGEYGENKWGGEEELWEVRVGKVVNYIPQTGEAAVFIHLGLVQLGDEVHFRGYVTNFFQKVKRLSLDGVSRERALAGQTPLIGVERPVDVGDFIYLVCGKKMGYFLAPYGVASLIAGAGAIFYGAIVYKNTEPEESPFKNKK